MRGRALPVSAGGIRRPREAAPAARRPGPPAPRREGQRPAVARLRRYARATPPRSPASWPARRLPCRRRQSPRASAMGGRQGCVHRATPAGARSPAAPRRPPRCLREGGEGVRGRPGGRRAAGRSPRWSAGGPGSSRVSAASSRRPCSMSISARIVAGLGMAGAGPSPSQLVASSASAAACAIRPRCSTVHARKPEVVATAAALPRVPGGLERHRQTRPLAVASESDQSNAQQAA